MKVRCEKQSGKIWNIVVWPEKECIKVVDLFYMYAYCLGVCICVMYIQEPAKSRRDL